MVDSYYTTPIVFRELLQVPFEMKTPWLFDGFRNSQVTVGATAAAAGHGLVSVCRLQALHQQSTVALPLLVEELVASSVPSKQPPRRPLPPRLSSLKQAPKHWERLKLVEVEF